MKRQYDVIVVGAGHAGCEAALSASRIGASTLLITLNMDHVAQMSCNPAIGGVGKGQVVREIDALGGAQGLVADAAAVQFRMLNRTKGPAVHSPRSQCDKVIYQQAMKFMLATAANLDILQGEVIAFTLDAKGHPDGVETLLGERISARALVLANGTFLAGKLHYGLNHFPGGRAGDPASTILAQALRLQLNLRLGRLKTGTPPRILEKSIDFAKMSIQPSEESEQGFSYLDASSRPCLPVAAKRNMPCYCIYSTEETAAVVRDNLSQAPMYQGKIKGIGARYCPSFEDKVVRFAHHQRHLLYLEPESARTGEYYINGFSTSLPPSIQHKMIATLPGMEHAVISRYAYAIEYDFIYPDQLQRTLAQKKFPNLFTAGQINGTSGYEEAAGQGILAGLNAARYAAGLDPVELPRDLCYIGVMIDDLVTKDIVEPYRLFTSRAEYRLHLRQDNADLRLCDWAHEHGMLSEARYLEFCKYRKLLTETMAYCHEKRSNGKTLFELLKSERVPANVMPSFESENLLTLLNTSMGKRVWQELIIEAHYDGYLQRESKTIERLHRLEEWKIPAGFNYSCVALSNEAMHKLEKIKPATLAQAARIDGVTPAEIILLQVCLTKFHAAKAGGTSS